MENKALHGTAVVFKIDGVPIGNMPPGYLDMLDSLHEVLNSPVKNNIEGALELQDLDTTLTEVTITYKTLHAMRKLTRKRNARGRRVMKIRYLKEQPRKPKDWSKTEFLEVDCTNLAPLAPVIDCLTECEHIGACCKFFILWDRGMPWPETQDAIEAQAKIDERGFPFEVYAPGDWNKGIENSEGPLPVWYLACKALMDDGLCGAYENRPQLCRDFRPGHDPLCAKDPGHAEAISKRKLRMGTPIT